MSGLRWTLAIAALVAIAPCAMAQEKVVVTVNDRKITDADVRFAEAELALDLMKVPPAARRSIVIAYLVDNQLFADEAQRRRLDAGAAYRDRLGYLTRRALRDEYFDRAVADAVSEQDVRRAFDSQVAAIKPQEEYRIRHILVRDKAEIERLQSELRKGADFADLARRFSVDTATSGEGGDLGYALKGQLDGKFEEAALLLNVGALSAPFQTQYGWHLARLEDRRIRPLPDYESVRDVIRLQLVTQKTQEAAAALREAARIVYANPEDGVQRR